MKNLKKVLALTVVLCMILGTFGAMTASAAFTDVAGTEYEEAVETLVPLGIIAGYDDGTYKPDQTVTRAEMAAFVVREMGLAEAATAAGGSNPFNDVADDHWALGSIKIAANYKIIVGDGYGTFRPDDEVTFAEAVKMVVCMLGYELRAQQKGKFPDGYLIEGTTLKLTTGMGFGSNDPAKRGTVAQLMYNALEVPLMEVTVFTETQYQLEITNKTLLYNNLEVIKEYGTVIATETAAVSGNTAKIGEARVQQEGTNYVRTMKVGETDPTSLVGESVIYYYKYDTRNNNTLTLLSVVRDTSRNDTMIIQASDIDYVDENNGRLYYWEDKEADYDTDYVTLADEADITLMVNNYGSDAYAYETINNIPNGYVKLIDTNRDGIYESVVVNQFKNYKVDGVDTDDKTVTLDNGSDLKLDAEKQSTDIRFSIKDKDGLPLEMEDIQEDNILSIFAETVTDDRDEYISDSKIFNIIVSTDTVEGTVTEKRKSVILIDDTKYELSDEVSMDDFDVESTGTFYLDYTGNIAYSDTSSAVNDYAFIYDVYGSASTRTLSMEAVTSTGDIVTLDAATSFRIVTTNPLDKDVTKGPYSMKEEAEIEEALNMLKEQLNGTNGFIASVDTNSAGKFTKIYLPGTAPETIPDDAKKTYGFMKWETSGANYYNSDPAMLGGYIIDSSTVIFEMPNTKNFDGEDVNVLGKNNLNNTTYYNYTLYDVDKKGVAKAIVITASSGDNLVDKPISIIKSVASTKNSDGDTVDRVYMVQKGAEVSVLTEDTGLFTPDSSAEEQYGESAAIAYGAYPGSVIVYSANSKNEITEKDMWRLYPRPVPADEYVENYFRTMFYQTWNNSWTYQGNVQMLISYGQVTNKNTSAGTFTLNVYNEEQNQNRTIGVAYKGARVTVVDTSRSNEDDMVTYNGTSISDVKEGSYVLVRQNRGKTEDIVVYKEFDPLNAI